jgi:hypothetical protein
MAKGKIRFFSATAYIFRLRLAPFHEDTTQGGRGVLRQEQGENPFPLDPIELINNQLDF